MKLSTTVGCLGLLSTAASASAIRLHTTFAGSNKTTYLCGGTYGLTECMFPQSDITVYYFDDPFGTLKYLELPPAGIAPVNHTLNMPEYDTSTFPALTFTSTDSGLQAIWEENSDGTLEGIWEDAPVVFYAAKNVSLSEGYDDLFTVGGTVDDIAEYDVGTAVDLQVVTITIETAEAVPTSQRIA